MNESQRFQVFHSGRNLRRDVRQRAGAEKRQKVRVLMDKLNTMGETKIKCPIRSKSEMQHTLGGQINLLTRSCQWICHRLDELVK